MDSLAHDLFLLMANLFQIQSKDRILLLFTNAINSLLNELNIVYYDQILEDENILEVCTSKYSFGYFKLEGGLTQITEERYHLLQNAVQMLAVILEKNKQEKLLEDEKKFLNEIVRERTSELQKKEEAFKALTDNSPDIIFRIDKKFRHLYASPNIMGLTGIEAKEFIGKTYRELEFPADLCTFWETEISNVFIDGKSVEKNYTYPGLNGDIILEWRIIPEFDDEGHIETVLSISRDITERKRFEEELKLARERAEESDQLKTIFLSNMSHEIRTPMNGILGFSRLLDKDNLPRDKRKQYIQVIDSSIHTLLRIISDIIEISKLEAGDVQLNYEKCNLNELLIELYDDFKENKSHLIHDNLLFEMDLEWDGQDCFMLLDSNRFIQVFSYLLNNAFKFTQEGKITFGYKVNDNDLLFYVSDTGIGISSGNADKIFERFRQEDDSRTRQYGGNGLGLTISKMLIELMRGKIWFRSEKNVGSTFYFTLPNKLETIKNKDSVESKKVSNIDLNDKKIMIVEDDETSVELIKEMFNETNVSIIIKENGVDAVEYFKKNNSVNIILMDIQLPKMNGLEATRQIKKIKDKVPVIAQTAYAFESDRINAIKAGCDDYIAKPFNKDQLLNLIQKYLH